MSKLVEVGVVSTATKSTFFNGKFADGSKAPLFGTGNWYYKTWDLDNSQPLKPAVVG